MGLLDAPAPSRAVLDARYMGGQGAITPEALGAVGNGTTDDSAAFLAFMASTTKSVLICDAKKRYRIDSQLVHSLPNYYKRITSFGGTMAEWMHSDDPSEGCLLDLRYSGAGGKIQALFRGTLEIDHVTLTDKGTANSTPFVYITSCVPRIYSAVIAGNPGKIGATCDQDGIILGGPGTSYANNDLNAGFQGYGGFIEHVSFTRIRRCITWGNYANSVPARANTVMLTCGSANTIDAPFVLDAGAPNDAQHLCAGDSVTDNLIELIDSYSHGVILRNGAKRHFIAGNHFWDKQTGKFVADVLCDESTGATDNFILLSGYSVTNTVSGGSDVRAGGKNLIIGPNNWFPAPTVPPRGPSLAGFWYEAQGAGLATVAIGAGTARAAPVHITRNCTLGGIGIEVTTAGSTGSVVRLGLYSDNGGRPGALLLDAGTVDTTTTGAKSITINQAVPPGPIWVVAVSQGAPTTEPVLRSISTPIIGAPCASVGNTSAGGFAYPSVTGALPATWSFAGGISGACPRVQVQVSA